MDGSTFQPPIHLDPNQDPSQQAAFINQNFQNLAATLESNSFKVVKIVPIQLVLNASGTTTGKSAVESVAHGLDFIPSYQAFITIDSNLAAFFGVGSSVNGPNPFLVIATTSGATLDIIAAHQVTVDSTYVYLSQFSNLQGTYTFTTNATVYLTQQLAT